MTLFLAGSPGAGRRRSSVLLVLLVLVGAFSGCLVRRREKIPVANAAAPTWRTASLAELLAKIKTQQDEIQTLNATATIEPSVSSPLKGEIVHYRDVRTFILIRRPASIRMIGLFPVVQNTAFDMTSDGNMFRLYIPSKNRFIIGKSHDDEHRSNSALENLRPEVIMDALLLKGPEPGETAVIEAYNEGENGYYILHVIRGGNPAVLVRNIWFERRNLSVLRLEEFDNGGDEVTDVRYSNYAEISGISYPKQIVIDRPKDLYGLGLSITNLQFNQPLGDDKFHLDQPPGAQLVNLGQQKSSAPVARKGKVG